MTDLSIVLLYVGVRESIEAPVMSPPVGVQLLGTLLRERNYAVELFDSRVADEDDIVTRIRDLRPHLIGLSFLSPSSHDATRIASHLRDIDARIVAGGPHASIHAQALLDSGVFECVVRREGELALVQLCDLLERGAPLPSVIDGDPWPDMDSLPSYASFDCYQNIYSDEASRFRPVYMQLGRGCPMRCTFCELPNRDIYLAPRGRFRSLERVMADIHTYVDRWNVNFVTLVDSIATLNMPLITGFITRMNEELPSVGIMMNAHVNRFPESLAKSIGAAQSSRTSENRISVWFGFESGSQRLLDFMQKQTTVERGLLAAKFCRDYGVDFGANLLLGLPTETESDYDDHRAFMQQIDATYPNPNILNPLPGTEMYEFCNSRGLLRSPTDYSIWTDREISERGFGPVLGVDYERVLTMYRELRGTEPQADTAGDQGARYTPWADSSDPI